MVVTAVAALLAIAALMPLLSASKRRAQRIRCTDNLKQSGLEFKTWALDHGDKFPMEAAVNRVSAGGQIEACRLFQVMSNSLADPRILVCPADVRQPAKDFARGFSNSNLSYFVGLDAKDSNPNMCLQGDRNLTNGPLPPNRVLVLSTNSPAGWTSELHRYQGNIGLADGSVQQFTSGSLNTALRNSISPIRLAMP